MSRHIDADKLIKFANNTKNKTIDANDIARFPTADVVKVVRCKDCRFYDSAGCAMEDVVVYPNDYCSYGERAEA